MSGTLDAASAPCLLIVTFRVLTSLSVSPTGAAVAQKACFGGLKNQCGTRMFGMLSRINRSKRKKDYMAKDGLLVQAPENQEPVSFIVPASGRWGFSSRGFPRRCSVVSRLHSVINLSCRSGPRLGLARRGTEAACNHRERRQELIRRPESEKAAPSDHTTAVIAARELF